RITLLRGQFRPIATWVLALLLLGLGSILPYLFAYFLYPRALYYAATEEDLWRVTNPFVSVEDAMYHRRVGPYPTGGSPLYSSRSSAVDVFDAPCLPFLAGWAGVVTVLG